MVLATEMNQAEVTLLKRELDMPFVLIDAYFPGEKTDSILMDNYSGMMQILKYAAEKGHERIGFVGSTIPTNNFTERFDYFRIGLENTICPTMRNLFSGFPLLLTEPAKRWQSSLEWGKIANAVSCSQRYIGIWRVECAKTESGKGAGGCIAYRL